MENKKLLSAIVALLVTAMVTTSITTVITTSIVSASPGATLSPTSARANTRVTFTVTVTNDYATDNIDNVLIKVSGFAQPIGYSENLVIAADNIDNAADYLDLAGDNMVLAEDNKKSSGPNIKAAGDNLGLVTNGLLAAENVSSSAVAQVNVYANLINAMSALQLAADAIDNSIENLNYISTQLTNAGTYIIRAAGLHAPPNENMENICDAVGENLDNAGADLVTAATSLASGDLENAGTSMYNAGGHLVEVANGLAQTNLKTYFTNAGSQLQTAGNKLLDAGNFLDNAGYALGVAENYLTSAGVRIATVSEFATAGANLQVAALLIENAGVALMDNVIGAGEDLKLASDNLENVALELGAALGLDEENAAAVDIDQAAENLKTSGKVNITTAGNEFISAATNLRAAALTMNSTTTALSPITWTLTSVTDGVRFDAIGDNVIVPGGSQTFVFLWTTPNITTETNYMISVLVSKEEPVYTAYENLGGFTVKVDGKKPTLTINVTQVGVTPAGTVNLVGTALDNARAKIEIWASEQLQSLGTVTVENSGNAENLVPPVTMTTTDNIYYYGYFTVGAWDDNVVVVRVASAKDAAGNENTANMENTITVDTRAPIFISNGLSTLIAGVRENVVKAGTTTVYRYVDNLASENMVIIVQDNAVGQADNDLWVTSVTIDTTVATRDPTIENRWTKTITLSEGLSSVVKVTATDRTGNTKSENIENLYIDTQKPTIAFNTIASITWNENGKLINENKPRIKITVLDPGYAACTGLGVAYENLQVYLDNDDNVANGVPAWGGLLENAIPWVVANGVFENILDNLADFCTGLLDGTYWVNVVASDNLAHAGSDNVIARRSFRIDTSKPAFSATGNITGWTAVVTRTQNTTTLTISGSGLVAEAGGTVKVWKKGSFTLLGSGVVDDLGYYSATVTLSEGANELWVSLTDLANNESTKVLYGTVTVDSIAPVLTVTAIPATTDKTTILVEGACDDMTATVKIRATGLDEQTLTLGAGGAFSYAVPLVEGVNTITISAVDPASNQAIPKTLTIERTVTSWGTYAIILVIVALILAAIAIFRKR